MGRCVGIKRICDSRLCPTTSLINKGTSVPFFIPMNYDIEKFDEYGYVIVTDFMDESRHWRLNLECDMYREFGCGLVRNDHGWMLNSPNNPCKLDGAMMRSHVFRDLASNDKLVSTARQLLGTEDIDTYISKFFPMVPREGFSVGWHQDNHYIRANSKRLVSCDVFVNGADKENGCLRVVAGSHNQTFLHNDKSHDAFRWIQVNESEMDITDIELDKPFAVFFHVDLVHGCYRNKSDRHRYSIAWEYIQRGHVPQTHKGHQSQDRLPVL